MKKHILLAIAALIISTLLPQVASARQGVSYGGFSLPGVPRPGGLHRTTCSWDTSTQTSDEAWEECLEKIHRYCFEGDVGYMVSLVVDGEYMGYDTFVPCP